MKFYELSYMVEGEAQERLEALAEYYKKINGWDEKDMLQFAVMVMAKSDIEIKLDFLEKSIEKVGENRTDLIAGDTGIVKKESCTKWSKVWEEFDWEEVKKKLAEAKKDEYKSGEYDVGITKEEFIEFSDWLRENLPAQYYKVILSIQLAECGLSDEEIDFWLKYPDILKMILDKIKN